MSKKHDLKVLTEYFNALIDGKKTFEIRKDDRNFEVGDTIELHEWSPDSDNYSGYSVVFRISYKLDGGGFGLEKGYCCLGLNQVFMCKKYKGKDI